jgi:hypothetical protein
MQEIFSFSLETQDREDHSDPPTSELFFEGESTNLTLSADSIKAQYRTKGSYLLVTSYDTSWREATSFFLIDSKFRIISKKSKGKMPYYPYLLQTVKPIDANTLLLEFYPNRRWKLSILEKRRFFIGSYLKLKPIETQ